jgi:hypothetical protein
MVMWADFNCASNETREGLRHIPDQEYANPRELIEVLEAIERRAFAIQKQSPGLIDRLPD